MQKVPYVGYVALICQSFRVSYGRTCCVCVRACSYAGLWSTLQGRLHHTTEQDVLYFLLQRPILFTPKCAIPPFPQSRPQKVLRPFLVCPISLQSTKYCCCYITGVFAQQLSYTKCSTEPGSVTYD